MKNVCSNCGNPETTTQPTISYEWDEKRGAEEIIYRSMTHCEAHGCPAHVTTETRRGNYRIAGEVLDEQREKLDLLWEVYERHSILYHRPYNMDNDKDLQKLQRLQQLHELRQNAIAVAAERKEQSR